MSNTFETYVDDSGQKTQVKQHRNMQSALKAWESNVRKLQPLGGARSVLRDESTGSELIWSECDSNAESGAALFDQSLAQVCGAGNQCLSVSGWMADFLGVVKDVSDKQSKRRFKHATKTAWK